ncbi:MAG TPA: hypothetical protein VKG26_02320 [Bacteroidia bacterium]|nr:hypothetical protein [Bacteroidia bacterium]
METEPRFIIIDDNPIDIIIHKFMIKNELKKSPIVAQFNRPELGINYIERNYSTTTYNKTILFIPYEMLLLNGYNFLESFGELDSKIREQVNIFVLSAQKKEMESMAANTNIYKFLLKPLSEKNIADIIYDIATR